MVTETDGRRTKQITITVLTCAVPGCEEGCISQYATLCRTHSDAWYSSAEQAAHWQAGLAAQAAWAAKQGGGK